MAEAVLRIPRSVSSWGAVLAGAAIAVALGVMLNILGLAIGTLSVDATAGTTPSAAAFGIGAGLWLGGSTILSMAAGGYIAGRLTAQTDDEDAVLNGLAMWAVAFLVGGMLVSASLAAATGTVVRGAGAAIGGIASGAGTAVAGAARAGAAAVDGGLLQRMRGMLAPADINGMSPEQIATEAGQLIERRIASGAWSGEDRQRLTALVARAAGVPEAEAARRIDAAEQQLRDAAARAEEAARTAADTAAKAAAVSAFWIFAAMSLGAIAAGYGASWAARTNRRRPIAVAGLAVQS